MNPKKPKDYSWEDIAELEAKVSDILSPDEPKLAKTEVQLIHKYILLLRTSGLSEKEIAVKPAFRGLPKEGVVSLVSEVIELYQRALHSERQDSSVKITEDVNVDKSDKKAYPDFGRYLSTRGSKLQTFHFLPFKMFSISKIEAHLYSTSSNIQHEGGEFCMTLDFGEAEYKKLLELLPNDIAKEIDRIFQSKFEANQMVELPFPVKIGVSVKLGKKQSNEDEDFIPFKVKKFYAIDE